jgi:exonuclease SbcC
VIPLRLSLENFLCYREGVPTLDFTGIHVACLCGPNGHGKSALLDSITWCLWGRSRGKTHDDLVSYGADQCRVELDFMARDTHYRAVRTHARGGGRRRQGVTDLQLQVLGPGGAQPITGNHIRETQAKIDQTIGMDYETFTNSAFLLQGRADEFSNKTPADRKAVLAKILGLESYDRLQALARDKLEQTKATAAAMDGSLGQMRSQVEQIGDLSGELTAVDEDLSRLAQQLEEQWLETNTLRSKVTELERQRHRLEESERQIQTLNQEMTQLGSAVELAQGRVAQYRELLRQAETIQEGVESLERARQRFETLEGLRQTYDKLNQGKAQLVRAIDNSRTRLEAQAEQIRHRVEVELPPKTRMESDLADQQADTRGRLETLEQEERAIAIQRENHRILSTRTGEAKSVAERYKVEGQELGAKLEFLHRTDNREAVCPLCQTPLGEDGCGRLAETYQAEIAEKRRLYRLNAAQLKQLEREQTGLEQALTERETALGQSRRQTELKLNEVERGIKDAQLAQKELEQGQAQLTTMVASLASEDFAGAEQTKLVQLDKEIEALGYDDIARTDAYSRTQELQPFLEKFRQLSDADANLPREEESAVQTQEMLQRRQRELVRLEEQRKIDEEGVSGLPRWEACLRTAEETQKGLEVQQQEAIARQGNLVGQLERARVLEREIVEGSARLSEVFVDQDIYQELVTAFGRQGVQAMLIETVVPRLEDEANLLLGRMTDNRMHLQLETQRERRTGRGGPIETLEIRVSDELGPRSYEMYSGGEAFRVNLALRIALSKVLAQRMGVPLPTLFIDEGFGTQDAAGRERILDVIGSIQDDFDKIIVITHLDEVKDVFPVRIEVRKEDRGSTFWLN